MNWEVGGEAQLLPRVKQVVVGTGRFSPLGVFEVQGPLGSGASSGLKLRPVLRTLALALPAGVSELSDTDRKELEGQLKAREDLLLPMYHQVAVQFADLHDKAGRMLEKGVIYVRARGAGVCVKGRPQVTWVQHTENVCTQACGMRQIPPVRITWGSFFFFFFLKQKKNNSSG